MEIAKLKIKPGEILVLRVNGDARSADIDSLRKHMPSGIEFLVVSDQVKLSVIGVDSKP